MGNTQSAELKPLKKYYLSNSHLCVNFSFFVDFDTLNSCAMLFIFEGLLQTLPTVELLCTLAHVYDVHLMAKPKNKFFYEPKSQLRQ